jgi:serine protease Do
VNPSGQGIGFAIPVEQLREVAPQLASQGHVVRSYMGVSVQESMSADLAESFGVPGGKGVVITEVSEDGPAQRAGLKAGDVVTSFDGEPTIESYRLRWLTARSAPGKRVRVGFWRSGKALEVLVLLSEKPGAPYEPPQRVPGLRREQEPFGFAVEEPPKDDGDRGIGIRVSSIDLRSCAYRAGLREGDLIVEIDGQAVADKAAYRKVISSPGSVSRLYVRRSGKAMFFGLRREAPMASRAPSSTSEGPVR